MISRRAFLASTAFAGTALAAPQLARAQAYPSSTVRLIVPFPPGGATDILGRVVSHDLQGLWGQSVVPEYKPGASGLLGTRQVITSPPDGYTLLLASTGAILSVAAAGGADAASYRVTNELAPISLVAAPSYILVVHPSVPVSNAAELIAYAKKNPGKLTFASSGAGTASHLSGALFGQMAGVELLHVPYRGTGPAVNDLLGGQINMLFSPPQVVSQHITVGKLKMIGTTGLERSSAVPRLSDHRRDRPAELPVARLVRAVRAGQDAGCDRGQGVGGRRQGAETARRGEAARHRGRGAGAEFAGGIHGLREQGHRQVARSGEAGEYQPDAVSCFTASRAAAKE